MIKWKEKIINITFPVITLFWFAVVCGMVLSNKTISNFKILDGDLFLFVGFFFVMFFSLIAYIFLRWGKSNNSKVITWLEVIFRILVFLSFIAFVWGTFMFTHGDGTIESII